MTIDRNRRQIFRARLCAILLCGASTLSGAAHAAEFSSADDFNAIFHVTGSLLESACHLDMSSAYQEVRLGEIATANLVRPGDQGTPVAVQLTLRGCIRTRGGRREANGGEMAWSDVEPVVGITFRADADPDTPELVGVRGARGFGLRLTDSQHHPIALDVHSHAWFVAPGDAILTYYVTPERTSAPLQPGIFHAYINLFLTYD